jgi:hypothetical protein
MPGAPVEETAREDDEPRRPFAELQALLERTKK